MLRLCNVHTFFIKLFFEIELSKTLTFLTCVKSVKKVDR